MLIHAEKLNPCKCGSTKKLDFDSDDMVPCWMVRCFDCGQSAHGPNWKMNEAIVAWNKANPVLPPTGINE